MLNIFSSKYLIEMAIDLKQMEDQRRSLHLKACTLKLEGQNWTKRLTNYQRMLPLIENELHMSLTYDDSQEQVQKFRRELLQTKFYISTLATMIEFQRIRIKSCYDNIKMLCTKILKKLK